MWEAHRLVGVGGKFGKIKVSWEGRDTSAAGVGTHPACWQTITEEVFHKDFSVKLY